MIGLALASALANGQVSTKEAGDIERRSVLREIEATRGTGSYLRSSVKTANDRYFVELTFVPHASSNGICRTQIHQHQARVSGDGNVSLIGPVSVWQAVAFRKAENSLCKAVPYEDLVVTGRSRLPDGYLDQLRSYIDSGVVRYNETELDTDDIHKIEFGKGFDGSNRIYLVVEFDISDDLRLAVAIDEVSGTFQIRERRIF